MTHPELSAARQAFGARWQGLQTRLAEEVGSAPRRPGWLILLLSVAAGVALGANLIGTARSARRLQDGPE